MTLFGKESHSEWRRGRSKEQIVQNGLPLNAEHRLRRLADNPRLFTTTLSVNAFVASVAAGMAPCGQVTGTSVFHTGSQIAPIYKSAEITELSHAQTKARRLALMRMLREAEQMGAHGVFDVHLSISTLPGSSNETEYTAIGTAFRWPGQRAAGSPFACTLTGQEVLALHEAGYLPVGLALGVCVYYQVATPMTTQVMRGGLGNVAARSSQELVDYTHGLNRARLNALRCLEEDIVCAHGDGVIAMQTAQTGTVHEAEIEINERKQRRHDFIVTFSALGTIIRSQDGDPSLPAIHSAIPLNL